MHKLLILDQPMPLVWPMLRFSVRDVLAMLLGAALATVVVVLHTALTAPPAAPVGSVALHATADPGAWPPPLSLSDNLWPPADDPGPAAVAAYEQPPH